MEYLLKKGRLYYGGNERLRYRIEYPFTDCCESADEFYERIAQNCQEYCCGELYESACGGGDRFFYELICRITHLDEKVFSVLMLARCVEGSGRTRESLRAHTWDINTGLMMPPRLVIKRYGKSKKHPGGEGAFLCDGEVISTKDGGCVELCRRR